MRLAFLSIWALLHASPALAAEPWYQRPACEEATRVVLQVDFEKSDALLRQLERSQDADDLACAVYNRVLESEMRITIFSENPKTLEYREKHLKRMFGFAKAHAKYGPRFRDLEIEARMRRVRVLFDAGEKTSAMGEARRTSQLLGKWGESDSPTIQFVKGTMYSALGEASFIARTALWAAGIGGSAEEGQRALVSVLEGGSVYRHEAQYIALHFSKEKAKDAETSPFGTPLELAQSLFETSPKNPQFAYEYARLLQEEGRCKATASTMGPFLSQLESDPDAWTPSIRAKVFLVSGLCSVRQGELAKAGTFRDQMAAQEFSDLDPDLALLSQRLEQAQAQQRAVEASRGG